MSTLQPSIANNEFKNQFPEQRVQTIADALGVYLTTSFCDSIVRHSGQSLEELAAQSRAMEAEVAPVSQNEKTYSAGNKVNKISRGRIVKDLGWTSYSPVRDSFFASLLG